MSTNRAPGTQASPSLRSRLLRAAAAGALAGLAGCTAADTTGAALGPTGTEPGFTAVHAVLATLGYLALLLAVAGLVAWALLRSLRVPLAGRSALLAVPLFLGYAALSVSADEAGLIPAGLAELIGWEVLWTATAGLLPMACATTTAVLLTGRLPRARRPAVSAQRGGPAR
ncbi:hypothetical protein [Nocardiopsis composta]|uniref:Uncharacterized protein n=1 Tax=Nocardiopsis composta TaxID=157465 RepID=A0A7W8QP53_9ACTN|nr:hypothetical protein [Nocardiopsis composta]MBB5433894.1 hypothetical protein [Nocardiopsis composta]